MTNLPSTILHSSPLSIVNFPLSIELRFMKAVQFQVFDNFNEFFSVAFVGCVARFLKSFCPTCVVVFAQKLEVVVVVTHQNKAVVTVAFPRAVVDAELIFGRIVLHNHVGDAVFEGFYAKMIVGFAGQSAVARVTFEQALREGDARGNPKFGALGFGDVDVAGHVIPTFVVF